MELNVEKCLTKFENQDLYLIGAGDTYRKYSKKMSRNQKTYVDCVECNRLRLQANRLVSNAIIHDGRLEKPPTPHNSECIGKPRTQLIAEQTDRQMRQKISVSGLPVKSLWREVIVIFS
jgi:hypothetical protein